MGDVQFLTRSELVQAQFPPTIKEEGKPSFGVRALSKPVNLEPSRSEIFHRGEGGGEGKTILRLNSGQNILSGRRTFGL